MPLTPLAQCQVNILGQAEAFHLAKFPSLEVNYPELFRTNVEQAERFVIVETSYDVWKTDLADRRFIRVNGVLLFRHYIRKGLGTLLENQYTDAVIDWFMNKTISQATYGNLRPLKLGETMAGFTLVSNRISFFQDFNS